MNDRIKLVAQMAASIAAGLYAGDDEAGFDAAFVVKKAERILEAAEESYQRASDALMAEAEKHPAREMESDYDPYNPMRQ